MKSFVIRTSKHFSKSVLNGIITMAIAASLGACASSEKKTEGKKESAKAATKKEEVAPIAAKKAPDAGSSIEAKEVAAEEQATFVTEIQFPKKKMALTAEDKAKLKKIFEQARVRGQVADIKSVAWADSEYPSVHTKKLSKAQITLAQNRNSSIENYFKSLNEATGSKFSSYNMAERPDAVSTLLGTANARIKKSLEVAGIPNTDTSVKNPSKASKAIVMIILKD